MWAIINYIIPKQMNTTKNQSIMQITCNAGIIDVDVVQIDSYTRWNISTTLKSIRRVENLLIQWTWRAISTAILSEVGHLLTATDQSRTVAVHVIICITDDCILDYNDRIRWIGTLEGHLSIWIYVDIRGFPTAEGVRGNNGRPMEENWNISKYNVLNVYS